MRLLQGHRGRFTAKEAMAEINPADSHYSRTSLVCVEDTVNKGAGAVWDISQLSELSKACKKNHLPLHLDGARCWNAMVYRHGDVQPDADSWKAYGQLFDSISICFSKGLGAPVGSVVLGSKSFIEEAHRTRKVLGGGMRQIGGLAAACMHALDHELPRLSEDHKHAQMLAEALSASDAVASVETVQTNIVIVEVAGGHSADAFVAKAAQKDVACFAFGPTKVRFVTHRDLSRKSIEKACSIFSEFRI